MLVEVNSAVASDVGEVCVFAGVLDLILCNKLSLQNDNPIESFTTDL